MARGARIAGVAWLLAVATACETQALREEFYRDEIRHLHERGNAAYGRGDLDAAAASFEAILRIAPDHAPALASLGNVALARGRAEVALRRFRRAAALDPALEPGLRPYVAFAATVPGERPGEPGPAALSRALAEGVGTFAEALAGVTDADAWARRHRRARSGAVRALDRRLLAAWKEGALGDCARCLDVAASWFAGVAGPPHWPLMAAAASAVADPGRRATHGYALALSYERHGKRARAVSAYLALLPDARARARLERLGGGPP